MDSVHFGFTLRRREWEYLVPTTGLGKAATALFDGAVARRANSNLELAFA